MIRFINFTDCKNQNKKMKYIEQGDARDMELSTIIGETKEELIQN